MSQMICIIVSLIELNNRSLSRKGRAVSVARPVSPCLRLWLVCTNRVLLYYILIILVNKIWNLINNLEAIHNSKLYLRS